MFHATAIGNKKSPSCLSSDCAATDLSRTRTKCQWRCCQYPSSVSHGAEFVALRSDVILNTQESLLANFVLLIIKLSIKYTRLVGRQILKSSLLHSNSYNMTYFVNCRLEK